MGASSELHIENNESMIARVEMPYSIYKSLKEEEFFESFRLMKLRDKSIQYSKSKEWLEVQKTIKEAVIHKEEIEQDIRIKQALNNTNGKHTN